MLTQTIRDENLNDERKPNLNSAFKYNLGRVISYTLLGGVIGSLGSIFSLSMKSQGIIQMLAAVFMILAGCKLFGLNLLKNSNFSLSIFKNRCSLKSNNPFLIGLLNGFMPCGALQTMQVYALSTGSFINGAFSMFIFALGTVPLMLGFGYISSKLSRTFSNKVLKYSGIFIIVLGLSMAQRGFSLTGINIPSISSLIASYSSELEVAPLVDGYQNVTLTANRYGYSISHTITPDSPIKLTLIADKLTSCNSQIYLPDYDEYIDLTQGDVIVEIPPTNKDISITCWMGMINTSIKIQ
ncbi:MAG: sulfite exporter TauE/SafE family protein [Terrisporobacter sp.]